MARSPEATGGYRPQDTGATAPQTVRNQPSSVQPPARQTTPRQAQIERRDYLIWEAQALIAEWRNSADPKDLQRAAASLMGAAGCAEWAARLP